MNKWRMKARNIKTGRFYEILGEFDDQDVVEGAAKSRVLDHKAFGIGPCDEIFIIAPDSSEYLFEWDRESNPCEEISVPNGRAPSIIIEPTHQERPLSFNVLFGVPCPKCGNGPMAYDEGCMKCPFCEYTECG